MNHNPKLHEAIYNERMTDERTGHHTAHLRPARMFRVVEIVVINAEKWLQVNGRKIPQAQGLEIINLFHQPCAEPTQSPN